MTVEDCFSAKVVISDLHELEIAIDRFVPFSSTDTAIIQSSTVIRRLPKLWAARRKTAGLPPQSMRKSSCPGIIGADARPGRNTFMKVQNWPLVVGQF